MTSNIAVNPSKNFVSFISERLIGVVCTTSEIGSISFSKSSLGDTLLNVWMGSFFKCGSLCHKDQRLFMSTSLGICELILSTNALKDPKTKEMYTSSYIPKNLYFVGDVNIRDMLSLNGDIYFVSSLLNSVCMVTPLADTNFSVVYTPGFVTPNVREDRCHVTGMCTDFDGQEIRYVTTSSQTDYCDGWKDHFVNGGALIDTKTGIAVCTGMTLPNSPRIHNGKLFLLDSGTGRVGWIDFESDEPSRRFISVIFIPGFLRGMSLIDNYAVVGVSTVTNPSLPVAQEISRLGATTHPGVRVVNLITSSVVHSVELTGVGDIEDVSIFENHGTARVLDMASSVMKEEYTFRPLSVTFDHCTTLRDV